jgi:hypothetical protein
LIELSPIYLQKKLNPINRQTIYTVQTTPTTKMPTGKPNPNIHSDDPESFTEHFNQNVDYTRDKSQNQGKATTGGQSEFHQGLRSTTMNPTADSFGKQVGRFF